MTRQETPPTEKQTRQPRTLIDDMIGDLAATLREEHKSEDAYKLRSIAERMRSIDGELLPTIAANLAKGDDPNRTKRQRTNSIENASKVVLGIEGRGRSSEKPKGATTVNELFAWCQAFGMDIGQFLEQAGISKRKRTIEDAIAADDRLTEKGKERLSVYLGTLLRDKEMRRPRG